ncbi:hypothetical protein H0I39_09280 [Ottowia beijingensis]|uniref:Uncharacterized protein n=1 Tax=Ottowia beijingensis TaxID=1207057 RepID=A0A853IV98_9BURK|nr:hypothetical protein [Ottowia beijingensis]NZA01901.1 hypothetical protein [Ottowia beijingensis]
MPIIPLCAVLLALPWLWPFTAGPMATTLPYLVAAGVAAVLLVLWPRDAERGATVAATGWLAAAVLSALIALLQYFDLEAPLFPGSTSPSRGRPSATCGSPTSWRRCW